MNAAAPRIVCIACETREVGMYDLVCSICRPQLQEAGLIKPASAVPASVPHDRLCADRQAGEMKRTLAGTRRRP